MSEPKFILDFQASMGKLSQLNEAILKNVQNRKNFSDTIIGRLSQINDKINELATKITDLKNQIGALQTQVASNTSGINDKQTEISQLKSQVQQLESEKQICLFTMSFSIIV